MTRSKTRTKRRRCRAVGQRGHDGRLRIWPSWTDTHLDGQGRIHLDGRTFVLEPCHRAVNHSSWLYPNFCRDCRDAWLENDYRERQCKAVGTIDANSEFQPIFVVTLRDMDHHGVIHAKDGRAWVVGKDIFQCPGELGSEDGPGAYTTTGEFCDRCAKEWENAEWRDKAGEREHERMKAAELAALQAPAAARIAELTPSRVLKALHDAEGDKERAALALGLIPRPGDNRGRPREPESLLGDWLQRRGNRGLWPPKARTDAL